MTTHTPHTATGETVESVTVPGVSNPERRFNAKPCKACGKVNTVLAKLVNAKIAGKWSTAFLADDGRVFVRGSATQHPVMVCACGAKVTAKPVAGKVNHAIACNAKCTSAKGHACECSCGGKNHGAGHADH